jgi:hypothetical protein
MQGVFIYAYDDSFSGGDLFTQEVDLQKLKEILKNKDIVASKKPLQDSYDFFRVLDSRCGK